jgi:prepilin-type N-terminal cleavage/methylation domain-containing protein
MNQNPSRHAFTLIELLVSIAILTIMVLLIAKIVADSSRASQISYQQAFDDANARAVIDTLMDDLSQMVVVSNRYEPTRDSNRLSQYGAGDEFWGDDIKFQAFLGSSNTIMVARYWVDLQPDSDGLYELKRAEAKPGEQLLSYPVLDHVLQFQVRFFDGQGREMHGAIHEIPQYVDFYLMVASDATHKRAKQMQRASVSAAAVRDYLYRNGRRHYFRGYPVVVQGRGKKPVGGQVQDLEY